MDFTADPVLPSACVVLVPGSHCLSQIDNAAADLRILHSHECLDEFQPPLRSPRNRSWTSNSDPHSSVLRSEGLASDQLGDAVDFFQLTEHEAHTTFCSCHLGSSFEASHAAWRIKGLRP